MGRGTRKVENHCSAWECRIFIAQHALCQVQTRTVERYITPPASKRKPGFLFAPERSDDSRSASEQSRSSFNQRREEEPDSRHQDDGSSAGLQKRTQVCLVIG